MSKFPKIGLYCGILMFSIFFKIGFAQNSFKKKVFRIESDSLNYNILVPNVSVGSTEGIQNPVYPLVLFLHGAGERGSDNEIQTLHISNLFLDLENQSKYPAFIIAPQCPNNRQWVNLDWTKTGHRMPEDCSESLKLTILLLNEMIKEYPIDTNRIYINGVSMGGYGVWDLISRFPERFAAAIPICGGGDTSKAKLFKDVAIWAFHGSVDKVVPVENTRSMVNSIKLVGGNPKYTEYAKVGHGCWLKAYKEDDLLEWLFNQNKIRK